MRGAPRLRRNPRRLRRARPRQRRRAHERPHGARVRLHRVRRRPLERPLRQHALLRGDGADKPAGSPAQGGRDSASLRARVLRRRRERRFLQLLRPRPPLPWRASAAARQARRRAAVCHTRNGARLPRRPACVPARVLDARAARLHARHGLVAPTSSRPGTPRSSPCAR